MKGIFVALTAIILMMSASAFAQSDEIAIIVNARNSSSVMTKKQVASLFLKRITRWENGAKVMPVDLKYDAEIREKFSKAFLNKGIHSVKAYWDLQLFAGHEVPPPEKSSDFDVIRYVSKNPGAIGYVSAATPLAPQVKMIVIDNSK